MGDDGTFLGEPFYVLGLFGEIAERNEKWKIRVTMSGRAKHRVELMLHVLPNPITPGTNDHAAANITRLGQLGRPHHLLIPFRKIFVATWTDCSFFSG